MAGQGFARKDELTRIEGPRAWIQWNGTRVCMDVYCACGARGHVDDDFTYYYRCTKCGVVYHVGAYVKLVPVLPGEHTLDDERVTARDAGEEVDE